MTVRSGSIMMSISIFSYATIRYIPAIICEAATSASDHWDKVRLSRDYTLAFMRTRTYIIYALERSEDGRAKVGAPVPA